MYAVTSRQAAPPESYHSYSRMRNPSWLLTILRCTASVTEDDHMLCRYVRVIGAKETLLLLKPLNMHAADT